MKIKVTNRKQIFFQNLSNKEQKIIKDLYKISIEQLKMQQKLFNENKTLKLPLDMIKYIEEILEDYKNNKIYFIKDNQIIGKAEETLFLLDNLTFVLNNKNKKFKDNEEVNNLFKQNPYISYLIELAQEIYSKIKK